MVVRTSTAPSNINFFETLFAEESKGRWGEFGEDLLEDKKKEEGGRGRGGGRGRRQR